MNRDESLADTRRRRRAEQAPEDWGHADCSVCEEAREGGARVSEVKAKRMRNHYCVNCGAVEPMGLEKCPGSTAGLTHLHARIGFVLPWFIYQMPPGAEHPERPTQQAEEERE